MIYQFKGQYRFLSNFFECQVCVFGYRHPTAEHAFQSHKATTLDWQERIRQAVSPQEAKRLGRYAPLKGDWEEVRTDVMSKVVMAKFTQNTSLARLLMDTGDQFLVEGNTWGDKFWGVEIAVDGSLGDGHNWLGHILMNVREHLVGEAKQPRLPNGEL